MFTHNNTHFTTVAAVLKHEYTIEKIANAISDYYADAGVLDFEVVTHTVQNGMMHDVGLTGHMKVRAYQIGRVGTENQLFAMVEGIIVESDLPYLEVGKPIRMLLDCGVRGLGFVRNMTDSLAAAEDNNEVNFAIPEREYRDFNDFSTESMPATYKGMPAAPAPQTPAAPADPVAQATIPQEPAAPTSPNQQQPAQPAAQTQQPVTIGQQSQAYVPPAPTVANNGMSSFGQPDEGNGV